MGSADLSDVYAYIVIFGVFFFMLFRLLKFAQATIDREYPAIIPDEFYNSYGYSFDFVLVFKVSDDEEDQSSDELKLISRKWTFQDVLQAIHDANVESRLYFSCQRDEIYVKLRSKPERLRAEASRINYRLLLDPERLRAKCNAGKKGGKGNSYIWKPVRYTIDPQYKLTSLSPFSYIHAAYEAEPYREDLYQKYSADNDHRHVFRAVDRINLIISILQAKIDEGGAGLNLSLMLTKPTPKNPALLAAFPLHEYDMLKRLQIKWLNLFGAPWTQPLDDVKDYFGERIGLYFLFLQHYTTLLIVPAVVGAITFIVSKILNEQEYVFMPIFAMLMMGWTSYFLITWRQEQSQAAMKWGTAGIEEEESARPLFEGETINSPITGANDFLYFPDSEKKKLEARAFSIVVTMIMCVIAIVGGIYWFQFWLGRPERANKLILLGINFAPIVGSLLNSVVIVTLNMLYQKVAISLNDYENHRTDTEYEDYLIGKIFLFQMVNSFAGLTYVSFVKDFLNLDCINPTCTGDVASSLSTIFLSALVSRAIIQIFVRKFTQEARFRKETAGVIPGVYPGIVEEQYILNEYPVITGTLTDYAGLVVQYGYMILFVAAFPLAPTIACVSSFLQIRIDAWKLCQAVRRPLPRKAEDIGVWEDMLRLLSYAGVLYNVALIFFTGSYLVNVTWEFRWICFILTEHACMIFKYVWEEMSSEVTEETRIQLERQDFLVSKVIRNQADENEEEFRVSSSMASFAIHDHDDDDWQYISPKDASSLKAKHEKSEWGSLSAEVMTTMLQRRLDEKENPSAHNRSLHV